MTNGVQAKFVRVKLVARLALGIVWIYQGAVPKLIQTVPLELDVLQRTGLFIESPAFTMKTVAFIEILLGLWLLSGYRERLACAVMSAMLLTMSVAVVIVEPTLLLGPFGGIIKNLGLFACAWIVWVLAPPNNM